jgi:putative inorganic carbon (HCO3(-)) transporter
LQREIPVRGRGVTALGLVAGGLLAYGIVVGGKWFALVQANLASVSLAAIAVGLALWWSMQRATRRSAGIPATGASVVAGIAMGMSVAANPLIWRRSSIEVWQVGLYALIWFLLHDAIGRRVISRRLLVGVVLVAGVVEVSFGFFQASLALPQLAATYNPLQLLFYLRPGGLYVNPNWLSAFLLVLLPFAAMQALTASNVLMRWLARVYTVLVLVLLLLTFSRGAWIAAAGSAVVCGSLALAIRGQLRARALAELWAGLNRTTRGTVLLVVIGCVVAAGALLATFTVGGRTLDLRTGLWTPAIHMFLEQPLTGAGPYTYGSHLSRFWSIPPNQVHTHAHNLVLNVAAELGVPGLIAVLMGLVACVRAVRSNLRGGYADRPVIIAATTAASAVVLHQLFDVTLLLPSVAFTALLAFVVATAPVSPAPLSVGRGRLQSAGIAALGLVLLVSGLWDTRAHAAYASVLASEPVSGLAATADTLKALSQDDPDFAPSYALQGLLYGLAANDTADADTLVAQSIAAYERFVTLEPNYAPAWANLGALYLEQGDVEQAIVAMRRATALAPDAAALHFRLGVYLEDAGEDAAASEAYARAVRLSPALADTPLWGNSPLHASVPLTESDADDEARQHAGDALMRAYERNIGSSVDSADIESSFLLQYLRPTLTRQFLPQVGYFPNVGTPAE